MADFLKNRNDFIHNQDKIEGWDLDTEEGIAKAKVFTVTLWRQAARINEILVALMLRWQEQTGIYPPGARNDEPLMSCLKKKPNKVKPPLLRRSGFASGVCGVTTVCNWHSPATRQHKY